MEKINTAMEKIRSTFHKEKRLMVISFCVALLFTSVAAIYSRNYSYRMQQSIADAVIRFHVLANSDERQDQDLKLVVRDEVLNYLEPELQQSKSLEDTRILLIENKESIELYAREVIIREGYDYEVQVNLSRDLFPTKTYGDVTLPAGQYEALRIEIGAAQGQNWWCVMFPPLCFVDVTKGEVSPEMKEELQEIFTEEEYQLISGGEDDLPIQVKFKVVEWWQERNKNEDAILIVDHKIQDK